MHADLRSDTVTKPSPAMLEAMMGASVGDDVFNEDPTVHRLESMVAGLFGKEAGLFCPSGTMTNQIAIKILSQPREEIICDQNSHVYMYEAGGLAFNSGLSTWLLPGDRGRINARQVRDAIRDDHVYYPVTSVVSLENTHNRGGGSIYRMKDIVEIREVVNEFNLKLHLDGARIFNALAEADYNAIDIGKMFDTISVCLSKGLGAPVGSVLLASADLIKKARSVRKVLGGGMRQAGYLAAAGIYAVQNNIKGLTEDHRRAKELGNVMRTLSFVEEVMPVDTNILIARLNNSVTSDSFVNTLKDKNILIVPISKNAIRMVTHLDYSDAMLDYTCSVLKQIKY